MNEESRVTSLHATDYTNVTLLIANVVIPRRKGD